MIVKVLILFIVSLLFLNKVHSATLANSWDVEGNVVGAAQEGNKWFVAANTDDGPVVYKIDRGGDIIFEHNLKDVHWVQHTTDEITDIACSGYRIFLSGNFGIISFTQYFSSVKFHPTTPFDKISASSESSIVAAATKKKVVVFDAHLNTLYSNLFELPAGPESEIVDIAVDNLNTVAIAGNKQIDTGLYSPFIKVFRDGDYLFQLYGYTLDVLTGKGFLDNALIGKIHYGEDGYLYALGDVYGSKSSLHLTGQPDEHRIQKFYPIDCEPYLTNFPDQDEDHKLWYARLETEASEQGVVKKMGLVVPTAITSTNVFSSLSAAITANERGEAVIAVRNGAELTVLIRRGWRETLRVGGRRGRGRWDSRETESVGPIMFSSRFGSATDGTVSGIVITKKGTFCIVGHKGDGEGYFQLWKTNGANLHHQIVHNSRRKRAGGAYAVEDGTKVYTRDYLTGVDNTTGNSGNTVRCGNGDVDLGWDVFGQCYLVDIGAGESIKWHISTSVSTFWRWRLFLSTPGNHNLQWRKWVNTYVSPLADLGFWAPDWGYYPGTGNDWYHYGYESDDIYWNTTFGTVYIWPDEDSPFGNYHNLTFLHGGENGVEYVQFSYANLY